MLSYIEQDVYFKEYMKNKKKCRKIHKRLKSKKINENLKIYWRLINQAAFERDLRKNSSLMISKYKKK